MLVVMTYRIFGLGFIYSIKETFSLSAKLKIFGIFSTITQFKIFDIEKP